MRSSVVLPAPFGPRSTTASPPRTTRSTPASTGVPAKARTRPSAWIGGSLTNGRPLPARPARRGGGGPRARLRRRPAPCPGSPRRAASRARGSRPPPPGARPAPRARSARGCRPPAGAPRRRPGRRAARVAGRRSHAARRRGSSRPSARSRGTARSSSSWILPFQWTLPSLEGGHRLERLRLEAGAHAGQVLVGELAHLVIELRLLDAGERLALLALPALALRVAPGRRRGARPEERRRDEDRGRGDHREAEQVAGERHGSRSMSSSSRARRWRSSPATGDGAAGGGAGARTQRRMTSVTPDAPARMAAKGVTHASQLKPRKVGEESTFSP